MITVFTHGGKNTFTGAKTENLIEVQQSESGRKLFTVTYGLQQHKGLTYAEACDEIGQCILHYACCLGVADNTGA